MIVPATMCLRKAKVIVIFNWPEAQEEYTLIILKVNSPFTSKSKLFAKDLFNLCELKSS